DRAVDRVLRTGLFRPGTRSQFLLDREMDTMEDFRIWLEEFGQRRMVPSHQWLIRKLERALSAKEAAIVGRGLVTLQLLLKPETSDGHRAGNPAPAEGRSRGAWRAARGRSPCTSRVA